MSTPLAAQEARDLPRSSESASLPQTSIAAQQGDITRIHLILADAALAEALVTAPPMKRLRQELGFEAVPSLLFITEARVNGAPPDRNSVQAFVSTPDASGWSDIFLTGRPELQDVNVEWATLAVDASAQDAIVIELITSSDLAARRFLRSEALQQILEEHDHVLRAQRVNDVEIGLDTDR